MEKGALKNLAVYLAGLLAVAAGVAVSIKSGFGVSPISSVPYTVTLLTGVDMGIVTALYNILLIGVQRIVLGDMFRRTALLQIPVALVFGYFTSACNSWILALPFGDDIAIRIALMAGGIVLIALGIFLFLPTGLPPLPGEATVQSISVRFKAPFPKVKVCFDCTVVAISATVCIVSFGTLGSVGAGTICAAVFVGAVIKLFIRIAGLSRSRRPRTPAESA